MRAGIPIDEADSLAVLVDFDNMKQALRWMMGRFENKPTEAIKGVAVCLQAVARHHVRLDDTEIKAISSLIKRLGRDVDGLREKNRQRLLQLDDPANLTKLLHLPAALVKIPVRLKTTKPRKAALKLQAALAIEILLNAPMRISNAICARSVVAGPGRSTSISRPRRSRTTKPSITCCRLMSPSCSKST